MTLHNYLSARGIDINKVLLPDFEQMASNIPEKNLGQNDFDDLSLYIQEQYGRFGNNIYQILHAVVIARYLGLNYIDCKFLLNRSHARSIILDGIPLTFGVAQPARPPAISTTLFYPSGFEICFEELRGPNVKKDAEKLGRLLFMHQTRILNHTAKKIAFHFRSGDIFSENGGVHPLYVQPPLSYYVLALDHICATLTNFEIYVVFENDKNPTIRSFIDILGKRNLPYILQSSILEEDAYLMASAHTIVSSFSTLCEAAALMNENIRRWYAFRTVTAHGEGMKPFLPFKFCEIMQSDSVAVFVVEDLLGQYTPPGSWRSSADQIERMQSYPLSSLRLQSTSNLSRDV